MACCRSGIDHTATGIKNRLLGTRHQFNSARDRLHVTLDLRAIGFVNNISRALILTRRKLYILRNINNNRAGASMRGNIKRLMHDAGQLINRINEPIVFRTRARNAHRIAFLKSIRTDKVCGNLTCQTDQRDGIHQRIRQARHCIRRTRARCHKNNAGLAGRPGIPLRSVNSTLLMPHQNMFDTFLLEKFIVNGKHSTARIPEDRVDALVHQRADDDFCTCHLLTRHGLFLPTRD